MLKKILIVTLGLFALNRFCFAEGMSAAEISKALPKSYTGTYVWGVAGEPWNAAVSFSKVKLLENGNVEATGTEHFAGTADPGKTYDSDVRATINAQTLSFEMEEIYLGKEDGFIPMVYKGKISPDLENIDTTWISLKGEKVSLVLKAVGR